MMKSYIVTLQNVSDSKIVKKIQVFARFKQEAIDISNRNSESWDVKKISLFEQVFVNV